MDQKLCIYVCSSYHPEVASVIDSASYPDVVIKSYPYDCINPSLHKENFYQIVQGSKKDFVKTIVIGGSCIHSDRSTLGDNSALTFYELDYCMELIFNKESIRHFIEKRYYLVSNGWLSNYREQILNWGFDADTAKKFFSESSDKIMLLDTGISGEDLTQIKALSEYMGLPYEILPVGLSHCRHIIGSIIHQWREDNDRNKMSIQIAEISKKNADNSLVFEQMLRLVDLTDEKEIVRQIFILIEILFSPQNISYVPIINGNYGDIILLHSDKPEDSEYQDSCFTIEVLHQGVITGVFRISEVAFVEYISKYEPMKEVIGRMSGLAIANARKYKIISDNENQLKKNEIELKALNDTKDKFFSIIAHDLRGPMGAFLGFSQILAEEYQSMTRDEIKDITVTMTESSNNLLRLLENLLEWSRMQRGLIDFHPEHFSLLSKIIETVGLITDPAKKKSIQISYNIPENLIIFADKHMFDAIIRNLVSNAIKFTPRGGKIDVSATVSNKSSVEIRIKDSGIGMPGELLSKLFIINENTSRSGTDGEPSTGLGLLLCKEFVEKNGGTIWAESKVGVGSMFNFSIPK